MDLNAIAEGEAVAAIAARMSGNYSSSTLGGYSVGGPK